MCPSLPRRKHLVGTLGALVFMGVVLGFPYVVSTDHPAAGFAAADAGTSCAAGMQHSFTN
jgi:hypothetical protein